MMENNQGTINQDNSGQSNFAASSELYEDSGSKILNAIRRIFGKIWPYIKSIGTEIIYYAFKSGRAAVKFALIQVGFKR